MIGSLLKNLGKTEAEFQDLESATDEKKHNPTPRGPAKFGYMTAGHVRRRHQRTEAAQKRKANRRFRREWMQNQRSVATLRGQLIAVGELEPTVGGYLPTSALMNNAADQLEEVYGGIPEALAHYQSILAERR